MARASKRWWSNQFSTYLRNEHNEKRISTKEYNTDLMFFTGHIENLFTEDERFEFDEIAIRINDFYFNQTNNK